MALVKQYTIKIDGKQAAATVGQLRDEVKRLEEELENTVTGSAEAEAALLRLGRAKAAIVEIEDSIDGLQLKNRGAVFADFADGVVGSFGVVAVAAKNLGLADLEHYQERLQEVLTVTSSFEAIQRGLNGETLAGIKNMLQLAKSYLIGGEAATLSSKVTRAALITTGVGALVILVATLAANWDKVTTYVKKNKEAATAALRAIAPPLGYVVDKVSEFAEKVGGLPQLLSGMAEVALSRLQIVGDVFASLLAGDFEGVKRNAGRLGEGVGAAFQKGVQQKNAQLAVEASTETLKQAVITNKRLIAEGEAAGRDMYSLKRRNLQAEAELLKRAGDSEKEALADKLSEIRALDNQHAQQLAEKRKAATEKAKADGERAIAEHQKQLGALGEEQLQTIEELREGWQKAAEGITEDFAEALKGKRLDTTLPQTVKGVLVETEKVVDEKLPSIADKVLVGLFGISPEKLDATKQLISDTFTALVDTVGSISNDLLRPAMEEASAALDAAQQRFSETEQKLGDARSRREADEKALDTAKGARREYLLKKIESERAAEQRLATEKRKAAAEQEKAQREMQRLQKISQQVSMASAAASAVDAGVKAVSSAATVPFPANIPAMLAALAAVVTVVASARGLAKTFRAGGLVQGPSHELGGIQMWHRSGAHLGEMEGGEYIMSRAATTMFLPQLATMNQVAQTRVLPPPKGMYAGGGPVPTNGLPPGTVAVSTADLSELLSYARATAEAAGATAAASATTAAHTGAIRGFGPARLLIGQPEALAIDEVKATAQGIQNTNRL